jgi:2-polyprenyl-3-methyl-5-hydroxy-6-metoxy-1,4-benzoquinol methylase
MSPSVQIESPGNGSCPCCRANDWLPLSAISPLSYQRCKTCGYELQVPSTPGTLDDRFEAEQKKHYDSESICFVPLFGILQREASNRRMRKIKTFLQAGKLLEIGPGSGETIQSAIACGFQIDAVEHSEALAKLIFDRTGIRAAVGAFEDMHFEPNSYDAYVSFHVIEHVSDVRRHLDKAFEAVKPGGFAFIATPNTASWDHRLLGRFSYNFSTAHFQLFSPRSLSLSLERSGWKIVETSSLSFTSSYLRSLTALRRGARSDASQADRGSYMKSSGEMTVKLVQFAKFLTAPMRFVQEKFNGGGELFVVARK